MTKENNNKEKTCLFYASDYHFEMITIPYIKQKLEEKKNVVIFTQNNLEETVDKVIKNINFEEREKAELKEIDWKDNDLEKIKKIEKLKQKNQDIIILVKGNEKYIKTINEEIEESIKRIDCYDINEVGENMKNILSQYNRILLTSGTEKLI